MEVAELLLAGQEDTDRFWAAVDEAEPSELAHLMALAGHEDPKVRAAMVRTLPLMPAGDPPSPQLVAAAVRLSADTDPRVRNWACFALAQQWRDVDTPELRQALAERVDDEDADTRCEALLALAVRRDSRALPQVRAALSRSDGQVWMLELVAAGALSDPGMHDPVLHDPGLHDLVLRHQTGWDEDGARTADLVRRLTDPSGPGNDALDGAG